MTVSGPSTGSPCVFPFTFNGRTYSRCTLDETPEDDKVAWCSTKVDSQGNHVAGKKFWGRCNPKCGQPDGKALFIKNVMQFQPFPMVNGQ